MATTQRLIASPTCHSHQLSSGQMFLVSKQSLPFNQKLQQNAATQSCSFIYWCTEWRRVYTQIVVEIREGMGFFLQYMNEDISVFGPEVHLWPGIIFTCSNNRKEAHTQIILEVIAVWFASHSYFTSRPSTVLICPFLYMNQEMIMFLYLLHIFGQVYID